MATRLAAPRGIDPAEPAQLADYRPVPIVRRHDGFTADRQRTFLTVLAETGSISDAARAAGISARSAYRLRQRPDAGAFADAWEQALRLATVRLTTLAYERAIKGTVREVWRDDQLVSATRTPSDKLLMFVLTQLLRGGARASGGGASGTPGARAIAAGAGAGAGAAGAGSGGYGAEAGAAASGPLDADAAALDAARDAFPATLARLRDHDVEMEPIVRRDFFAAAPGDPEEDA
jgi:hypothetical protein